MTYSAFRHAAVLAAAVFSLAPAGRLSAQPAFVAAHGTVCGAFAVTTGGFFNVPILSAVPAGDTLILAVGIDGTLGAVTLTDTGGNTWTLLATTLLANPSAALYATRVGAPLTTADHVTVSAGSSAVGTLLDMALAEYSGIAGLPGARDQLVTAAGTGTAASATLPNPTTQASEILVGTTMAGGSIGLLSHAVIGFSSAVVDSCAASSISEEYDVVSSTGTYTYGWTFQNSVPWAEAFVSLKAGTTPAGLVRFDAR